MIRKIFEKIMLLLGGATPDSIYRNRCADEPTFDFKWALVRDVIRRKNEI